QHGWAPFVTMQDHYNLIYREEEREMLPLCWQEGVAVIPWSPLTPASRSAICASFLSLSSYKFLPTSSETSRAVVSPQGRVKRP
ncbi:aldo/keto reductase, partial [Salmonella enterica subsp. enterica serovar Montevideo]|nr:aldo/keto reductase [Salmonella enterica subsp. enterica serovar Montevideo]